MMADRRMGWAACMGAILLLGLALISGPLAYSRELAAGGVSGAWVRLAAAPGRPAAGYMVLEPGPARVLTGASSPAATRVELHRTVRRDGVARMEAAARVPVAAGERLAFAPGGLHLMLFGLAAKPGDAIPITLTFAAGPPVTLTARAVAAGADPTDPHANH